MNFLLRRAIFAFVLIAGLPLPVLANQPLTEQQRHGQQIYTTGISPVGDEIHAILGGGQTRVPGALFPCAKCHGSDGTGQTEGGVVAADITRHTLTKPYDLVRDDRRTRPPYSSDAQVIRAFSMGLDSGGETLNQIMPRYLMTRIDAQALVTYLKVLGSAAGPGVTPKSLILATVAPPEIASKHEVPAVLSAHFGETNRNGGIYGRSVSLRVFRMPAEPDETGDALRAFLADEAPLAFVAPYRAGRAASIEQVLADAGVPAVGVAALPDGIVDGQPPEQVFALPDLSEQARALGAFAQQAQGGSSQRIAVVYAPTHPWSDIAARVALELSRTDGDPPLQLALTQVETVESQLARVLDRRTNAVIILAPASANRPFLRALASTGQPMVFLAPTGIATATFSGLSLPPGSRVFLSHANTLADATPAALNSLEALDLPFQAGGAVSPELLGTMAASKIMIEGLRRSGRAVTRARLTDALRGLYRFETGFVRPVTFGPNRSVGTGGVHVVEYDITTGRSTARYWIDQP